MLSCRLTLYWMVLTPFVRSFAAHSSSEHLIEKTLGDRLLSPPLMLNDDLWHLRLQLKAFTTRLLSFVSMWRKGPAVLSDWCLRTECHNRETLSGLPTYRGDFVSSDELGKIQTIFFFKFLQHEWLLEKKTGGARQRENENITREMARREEVKCHF